MHSVCGKLRNLAFVNGVEKVDFEQGDNYPDTGAGMINNLRNLGPRSAKILAQAGIVSEKQLRTLGSVAVFLAVKRAGCAPSVNLLWALESALSDRDWKQVARLDRLALLMQLEDAEKRKI